MFWVGNSFGGGFQIQIAVELRIYVAIFEVTYRGFTKVTWELNNLFSLIFYAFSM
jgi:hypothetical protein